MADGRSLADKDWDVWYNARMMGDVGGEVEGLVPGRLAGVGASLIRPFWSFAGVWTVACGALAGSEGTVDGGALVPLLFVLLLTNVGWIAAWQLVADTDWFHPMAAGWPPRRPARVPKLPYTQPGAPAGRLWWNVSRLAGWWREAFWPEAGAALVGLATAVVLTAVFSAILLQEGWLAAEDVRLLSAAVAALAGAGLAWRRHGREWLLGRSLVFVALPWLAGHLAMAPLSTGSWGLAVAFAVAAWGTERLAHGLRGGPWLMDGAQAGVVALLAAAKEPLVAGAVGMLLVMQIAQQPAAVAGIDPAGAARRMRPLLLVAMVLAAMGLP